MQNIKTSALVIFYERTLCCKVNLLPLLKMLTKQCWLIKCTCDVLWHYRISISASFDDIEVLLGYSRHIKSNRENCTYTTFWQKCYKSNHIRSHCIFFIIFFALHAFANSTENVSKYALLAIFKLNDIYLYAMCFSLLNTFIKSKNGFFFLIFLTVYRKTLSRIPGVKCVPGLDWNWGRKE